MFLTEADRELGLRPLTARSLVASMLLGTHPPRLPAYALVASAELFGLTEGACRTALSRMVASGEIATIDGWYELGSALVARQQSQDLGRLTPPSDWDRLWRTLVVTADRRSAAERVETRSRLAAARFAELRVGVWTRPNNLTDAAVVADLCAQGWLAGTVRYDVDPSVEELWSLDDWHEAAGRLLLIVEELTPKLEAGDRSVLARGFIVAAAGLRHLRDDPLLPPDLLPRDWLGPTFRAGYDRFDEAYRLLLREFTQNAK